jgi:hypothetical protein
MADTAVESMLQHLLTALDQAGFGPYRAVLHGSAARGQHIPGWSDVNLVLIFERLGTDTLEALREPLRRWHQEAHALPLMLTLTEWARSADAYPLEIAEMRTGYRVLRGPDPLAGLTVRRADLRAALERELRGKLLRLRQGYAMLGPAEAEELSHLVRRSVAAILVLLRGLVLLTGGTPPADPADLIGTAARSAGFDPSPIRSAASHRGDSRWRCPPGLMAEFLAAIEAAARFVDHFRNGAQE